MLDVFQWCSGRANELHFVWYRAIALRYIVRCHRHNTVLRYWLVYEYAFTYLIFCHHKEKCNESIHITD